MSAWWWVPIGLAAWLSVSLAVGLLLARFFRHAARARDALDALAEERLAKRQEPPQDGPHVALRAPTRWGAEVPFPCTARRQEPVGLVPAAARAGFAGEHKRATVSCHSELKLCVLRARRVRGLATSDWGLTAYRRLVGIEGPLVLTPFGLRPDLDEYHHDDTGP